MNRFTPAVVGIALILAVPSAYAMGGPPHMPGYNSGEQNLDPHYYGYGYGYWRPYPGNGGFNALYGLAPPPPSAYEPAPNGTVSPWTHQQTNGY
jgi:hypothetical protein